MKALLKSSSNYLFGLVFALAIVLVTACGGGSGGGSGDIPSETAVAPEDVTTSEAQTAAKNGLTRAVKNSVASFDALSKKSESIDVSLAAIGLSIDTSGADGGDSAVDVDQVSQQIQVFITIFLNSPQRTSGNTITYTPDSAAVCSDDLMKGLVEVVVGLVQGQDATSLEQSCQTIVGRITIEQVLVSDTKGSITYRVGDREPVVITYETTKVCYRVDLAQLKAAIEETAFQLDPTQPVDLPATLSGVIEVCNTTRGEESFRLAVSILQAINIEGTDEDSNIIKFNLAAANDVFVLDVDGVAGTAFAETNFAAIDVQFPVDDPVNDSLSYPTQLKVDALTGRLDIDDVTLMLSKLGLGDVPVTSMVIERSILYEVAGAQALDLRMGEFGLTVKNETKTITFDRALDIFLSVDNVNGVLEGLFGDTNPSSASLDVDAPANTEILVLDDPSNQFVSILKLNSGQIDVVGGGALSGLSASVTENSCFRVDLVKLLDTSATSIPQVACPSDTPTPPECEFCGNWIVSITDTSSTPACNDSYFMDLSITETSNPNEFLVTTDFIIGGASATKTGGTLSYDHAEAGFTENGTIVVVDANNLSFNSTWDDDGFCSGTSAGTASR